VRYDDFVVRVQRAGKAGAAERVRVALENIRVMELSRILPALPLPPMEGWKFARVLPRELYLDLVASDYYHAGEFKERLAGMEIVISSGLPQELPPE
jgi:hypothetical protein